MVKIAHFVLVLDPFESPAARHRGSLCRLVLLPALLTSHGLDTKEAGDAEGAMQRFSLYVMEDTLMESTRITLMESLTIRYQKWMIDINGIME